MRWLRREDANKQEDAKIRKAELLMKMSELNISPQASQALVSCASEVLTGIKCIPLPEVDKTYSATEAGEIIRVSAQRLDVWQMQTVSRQKISDFRTG